MAEHQPTRNPSGDKLTQRRALWLELQDLGLKEIAERLEIAQDLLDEAITEQGAYPGAHSKTYDKWNAEQSRCHYFVDQLGAHVHELREAIEKAGPAQADPGALWAEFEAARGAIDGLDREATEAERDRWSAAQRAIVDARPTDLQGLLMQLRYILWCCDGCDVTGVVEQVLPHTIEQLAAMAQAPAGGAGPLSSTF